ncbi:hypothetical protein Cni_G28840 [Canna indica]|uniref:Uncharacterized protein n=1 Tax=Canna indica TaxID=4628 RepID=A0AAQ3QSV9_9LILI|nr:hypothetical protein Cni_G28840 [Canna indica]
MNVHLRGHRRHHSSTSLLRTPPSGGCCRADEPSSPRVGCAGQIKIKRSKTMARDVETLQDHGKLVQLTMRIFSRRRSNTRSGRRCGGAAKVSFADLDPPLPVKQTERSRKTVSLWNRRCGGEILLEGLKLQSTGL